MFNPLATLAVTLIVLCASPVAALAQAVEKSPGDEDCDKFSWSVDRERAWFSDKHLPRRASGARLRTIDRAVDLSLRPTSQVDLFLPPEVQPKAKSFSGEVTFRGVPRPGTYQVTLSAPASIDVFENAMRLSAVGFTSAKRCPGVYESLRFELAPGDLVLIQITDASTNSIKVAFSQAEVRTAW